MGLINLAADYGWGPYTLMWIFLIVVVVTTAGFLIVMATSRRKRDQQTFASKRKHHPEMYWAIGVAGVLIWLWVNSYPWMPPVAFSAAANTPTDQLQVVNVTAGQWFWIMNKGGEPAQSGESSHITLFANQPVKFVAHSVDVNHGFGVFRGDDGAAILFQMQVIPNMANIFYYTFREPGIYTVRCLEYCGYAHPYMTSVIEVVPVPLAQSAGSLPSSQSASNSNVSSTAGGK
jgi:cytochrome c oxidase subunit II